MQLLRETLLKDIMVTRIVSINITDPFSFVWINMQKHHVRHLPVLDEQGKLAGIITERDLFRIAPPHKTEDGWVYDEDQLDTFVLETQMTANPIRLKPTNTIADAIEIFVLRRYGCIPIVTDETKLVGLVTPTDVLKFIGRWLNLKI